VLWLEDRFFLKNVRIGEFRMSTNSKTGFGGQGGVVSSSGGKSLNRSVARDSGSLGLPKIDALFLLGVARKHWKWIVPVALLLSGIGAALVLSFFKPVYDDIPSERPSERASYECQGCCFGGQ
jgi:hypothetical protein